MATEEEEADAGEALDVATVASGMGLAVVSVDAWMVVQRASFDLALESEPYHAMQGSCYSARYDAMPTAKFTIQISKQKNFTNSVIKIPRTSIYLNILGLS